MSNNKNSIIRPSGQSIAAKFGQKDWVKKLKAASGKPIIPAKPFFGAQSILS